MRTRHLLQALEESRIAEAIRSAEARTSGEIRVFISSQKRKSPPVLDCAAAQFTKLEMAGTAGRNAILIYLSPETQEFAIIGDAGIHAKCDAGFWAGIAGAFEARMRAGDFTGAIVAAVSTAGEALSEHFPNRPGDVNELPNSVERD